MALFPKCGFQVLLPGGVVLPGGRVEGELVVEAPEPIPRAEHIDLVFRSTAWAGYGSGKNRSVVRRVMFVAPFRVSVLNDPMPAGTHRFPFALDVPAWLPPAFRGDDCAIEHVVEARVDVDWAIDPVAKLAPVVGLAPRQGTRAALTVRSPMGFHEAMVLEVMLPTAVIRADEPLEGQIALRSGHGARFDAIDLALASTARITMGRGDRRRGPASVIRVPAASLRGGAAVPFRFPANPRGLPTLRTSFIDHEVVLGVSVDIPWALDPSFELLLDVLPAGSTMHGEASATVVGSERLARLAAAMAASTGLAEARAPTLVEGSVGPVALRIVDAAREARLGVDVDITFPDVELGIAFRKVGLLDGFRESPLLPKALADRYLLRVERPDARPSVDEQALTRFVTAALGDLSRAEEVRFSDHHLAAHFATANDGAEEMVAIARGAHAIAKAIAAAIDELPFPSGLEPWRAAWRATATEQQAWLVPTGPSLRGLSFHRRVLSGEVRTMRATLRTAWSAAGPSTHVDLDLQEARLPKAARTELEDGSSSERLRAIRAWFPSAHVVSEGSGVTLDRPGGTEDPRALLSSIEAFFDWVLESRGERSAEQPYR